MGSLCQRHATSKENAAGARTTPESLRQKQWLLAGPLKAHESSPAAVQLLELRTKDGANTQGRSGAA